MSSMTTPLARKRMSSAKYFSRNVQKRRSVEASTLMALSVQACRWAKAASVSRQLWAMLELKLWSRIKMTLTHIYESSITFSASSCSSRSLLTAQSRLPAHSPCCSSLSLREYTRLTKLSCLLWYAQGKLIQRTCSKSWPKLSSQVQP